MRRSGDAIECNFGAREVKIEESGVSFCLELCQVEIANCKFQILRSRWRKKDLLMPSSNYKPDPHKMPQSSHSSFIVVSYCQLSG
jgi:hypothetical protein